MSDSWSRNSRAKEAITAASCPRQAMPCSLPKPNLDSRGRFALRFCILNWRSTWGDVRAVLERIVEVGAERSPG